MIEKIIVAKTQVCKTFRIKLFLLIFIIWCYSSYLLFCKVYDGTSQISPSKAQLEVEVTPTKSFDTNETEINKQYCQSDRCKFLFAYRLPEQETQANRHFLSFVQLAEKLNRTMILTNVGSSHISACNPFPFDFYYNVDKLKERFPKVNFITQERFQEWTRKRKEKPDTFHGLILKNLPFLVKNTRPRVKALNQNECLNKFDLKLNDDTKFKQINFKGDIKFENLLLTEFNVDVEVLLMRHDVRYPLFNEIPQLLDYAEHIVNAADSVSKKLRPYIASHWRMELGRPMMMINCSNNLIRWFKDKQRSTGIDNLYLATDYPLLTGRWAQSSTWHEITEFHTTAIQNLNSSVSLNTWVSLHPFDYLPKNKWTKKELTGAGIQGILDKLVLIQADYFVSCPKKCGRYKSKFTRKVREERRKMMKNSSSNLKNVWEMWYNN